MHEVKKTITEIVETPDHAPRVESSEFRKNKRVLVRQLDLPCWTCGSRDAREVHHLHEYSLWDSLNPERVLDTLHVFDPYGFTHQKGEEPITTPDDIRNLLVLCGHHTTDGVEVPGGHHRGTGLGIHETTFPTWIALRSAKEGVSLTDVKALMEAHHSKPHG